MGDSLTGGTQQLLVFLLKMIILGCCGGTTILENPHMCINIKYKSLYRMMGINIQYPHFLIKKPTLNNS